MKQILVVFLLMFWVAPCLAVNPDEMLQDRALEQRARTISSGLRCLVCQNQSIDDSDAGLARDLRVIVRERLSAGDSDAQVFDYVVARYGNFVLLKPPVQTDTIILWAAPFVLLALAVTSFLVFIKRTNSSVEDDLPLAEDEHRKLAELEKTFS
jgi:cytochrome c-type biogenesis protein CcmH